MALVGGMWVGTGLGEGQGGGGDDERGCGGGALLGRSRQYVGKGLGVEFRSDSVKHFKNSDLSNMRST